QFVCKVLVDPDYIVEGIRNLASHACPVVRQMCGKIAAFECHQGCKHLLVIELVGLNTRTVWRSHSGSRGIFHMQFTSWVLACSGIRRIRSGNSYSSAVV